jgi:hypothetical protein
VVDAGVGAADLLQRREELDLDPRDSVGLGRVPRQQCPFDPVNRLTREACGADDVQAFLLCKAEHQPTAAERRTRWV